MLKITVLGDEYFDESTDEFKTENDFVLEMEHSLVTLSKWESTWEKPFLSDAPKTTEETLSYIEMMIQTSEFPSDILDKLSKENHEAIQTYIQAKMTATWFAEKKGPKSREVITSEIIYHWMIALQVPFECQHWHLNRLLTLIQVCNDKNQPAKKMGRRDLAARNRALNAQRKAELNTTG